MHKMSMLILAAASVAIIAVAFVAGWLSGNGSGKRVAPASAATEVTAVHSLPDPGPPGLQLDAIRGGVPVDREGSPPPMARVENADLKRARAYPMQPPTIPHAIDGYEVDKNTNRCMLCHARANAEKFQAPPVSVTHYMDRDAQFLATISPRRYFCNQCHVVQTDARPLVANTFQDIDTLLGAPEGE